MTVFVLFLIFVFYSLQIYPSPWFLITVLFLVFYKFITINYKYNYQAPRSASVIYVLLDFVWNIEL